MDLSRRIELQSVLEDILGTKEVFFQPPANVQMKYPSIVYNLDYIKSQHADNRPYIHDTRYLVTLMHRTPDSEFIRPLASLPKCAFSRAFVKDGLYHTSFTLYF